MIKITQFIKKLSRSNAGLTKMNDVYITIASNANPISIFGNAPSDIEFTDRVSGEKVILKFKHESNGEYRLSKLGPYVRKKNAKEGDNIYIEKINFDDGNLKYFIDLKTNNNIGNSPGWQKYEFQF